MKDLLNPAQAISLFTVLKMFEENLRQINFWLDGAEINGILYHSKLHLPADKATLAKEIVAHALNLIEMLAKEIKLEPIEEDPARQIIGQMSVSWANLVDTRSRKLKRYGEVNSGVAEALDPHIDRLARLALNLASIFESKED